MATFNDTSISVSINIGRNEIDREDMEACVNARMDRDQSKVRTVTDEEFEAIIAPARTALANR